MRRTTSCVLLIDLWVRLKYLLELFHRSESGEDGNIVLNQAIRDEFFDPKKEFSPISLRSNKQRSKAIAFKPVYRILGQGEINRLSFKPTNYFKKNTVKSLISK